MNEVWTIAELSEGGLKAVSFELLGRGRALADKLGVDLVSVALGADAGDDVLSELIERGADKVIFIEAPRLADFVCETWSKEIAFLVRERKPQIVLAAATTSGRTLMPHLAVSLHAGLTADCTELDIEVGTGNLLQTRPAIGGNIMATIKTPDHRPQMATVRPKSSRPLERDACRKGIIERLSLDPLFAERRVRVLGMEKDVAGFENLEEAQVVVSGGRGLKKAENFRLVRELAEALGGAVGGSREAVDRGWISYPHQVGLSGKTISPKLYICAGVSGAIQHLAGIKTAGTIVSINADPEAPIHKLADFALVGDLFEVLPRLTSRLQARLQVRLKARQAGRDDIKGGCR
ncbi:MAG: electron transfer flavoprotein subunit alpha/FixB family protein [Spirochaetes bacterium]|nr:electron transfer flavoprotein subunit alpha/FixB family protein [Spirochaetota bacterium]